MTNLRRSLIIFVFMLTVALTGAGLASALEAYQKSTAEAWDYIVATPDVFILDVRSAEAFNKAHIDGAVNIPVDELEARIDELPKGRPILVYCQIGARSEQAYQIIRAKRPELEFVYTVSGNLLETPAPDGAPAILTAP